MTGKKFCPTFSGDFCPFVVGVLFVAFDHLVQVDGLFGLERSAAVATFGQETVLAVLFVAGVGMYREGDFLARLLLHGFSQLLAGVVALRHGVVPRESEIALDV